MNILHLEMSRFFSSVIEKVAASEGYHYRNERSIDAGLAALDEWDFDMIITAHILEDGRAESFMRKLSATRHKDIPVIVVSSDDSTKYREIFFELGVVDYLQKSDLVPKKILLYFKSIARGDELLEELKNLRIAVLDDSRFSLNITRSLFRYYGVENSSYFKNPREMLAAGDFDLYIIDVVMPEMSGDEVILAIRESRAPRGIIVVSSLSNRLSMAHTLTIGADDFIMKPFDGRDFIARVKGVVRNLVLMRELEEKSRQMEEMSQRDSLTKLWNHGHIHEILQSAVSSGEDEPITVLLLDLDHFKSVNDRFGHPAGDEVLLEISDLLSEVIGDKGEVGRYGGEEFLAVLPGTDLDEGRELAEGLLERIRGMDFDIAGLKVSASCGLAASSETSESMALVEKADERLLSAKKSGRDRVAG